MHAHEWTQYAHTHASRALIQTYTPTAAQTAQRRLHAVPLEGGPKPGGRGTLSEQPFSFGEGVGGRGGGEGGGRGGRISAGNRRRVDAGGVGDGRDGNSMGESSPHAKLADLDPPERELSPKSHRAVLLATCAVI